jgi:hypothetical protein
LGYGQTKLDILNIIMKRTLLLIALLFCSTIVFGQGSPDKHGVYFGIGGNVFCGDLGGGGKDAAHFLGVRDINTSSFRPALQLGYSYKLYPNLAVRAGVMWLRVYGSDTETTCASRKARNLNFRSDILSFGAHLDYYLLKEREIPRYASSSMMAANRFAVYFTVGFSMFHFNPQGELDGQWYDLQPLCTEGQGTSFTYEKKIGSGSQPYTTLSAPYKLLAAEIPFGFGVKYQINKKLSLCLEGAYHVTTTDYIDDCSSNYFNWDESGFTPPSELTTQFADRRINTDGSKASPAKTGEKRGNSGYNDAFVTFIVTAHYRISSRHGRHSR